MAELHIVEGYYIRKWGFASRNGYGMLLEACDDPSPKITRISGSNGKGTSAYLDLNGWNLDEERDIIPAKAIITDKLENING
jgi:hypothetical protein